MAVPLPPALEARLTALADRVRRLRAVRGASRLAVAAVLAAVAVVLLDFAFTLSAFTRTLLQIAWFAGVGWLAWHLVARSWRAGVSFGELAREIEARYPELGERLLTLVTLADDGPGNGSPQLVAGLARETELRTRSLDLAAVAPAKPANRSAAVAGVVLLVGVVVAAAVPGSGERLRRVGVPWYRPVVSVPFRVLVPSGDAVVRRGDPVTLSAYVERTDPAARLPDAAVLVIRDGPGAQERKLAMTGDGAAAFHLTRPGVTADFEYRVEAGGASSGWYAVAAADPVELTDDTTTEIVPPPYATGVPRRRLPGLPDLDGLQHSTAHIRFRFNRPASAAVLEWRPEGRNAEAADHIPVQLAPDGLGGTAAFRLRQNGTLRVVLVGGPDGRRLRTELPVSVRATPDAPPRFELVSGVSAQPRTVRPGEHVPITLAAFDDNGVSAAELEFAVGPDFSKSERLPIPLTGAGTPHAEGRFTWDLTGRVREGDTVRFRVRVTDGRSLDDPRLGPQQAVYPPAGWAELKISASAPPLAHQEILAQRDALRDALLAAGKEAKGAAMDAEQQRTDTAGKSPLGLDHTVRLNAMRDRVRAVGSVLQDAARDAALTPELRPLAAEVRGVAERQLREADDALRRAGTDSPADRKAALDAAAKALHEAVAKIEELAARNDRLARDRLDRLGLEGLAADQKDLADRTKPGAPTPVLLNAQRDLQERLRKLLADSDPLRHGADAAADREARRLADDLRSLADAIRDLDAAARQLTADTRRSILEGVVKAQLALGGRAAVLLARTTIAAGLAGVSLPKPEEFRRVADLIAAGRTVEALVELEKLAAALDKTAEPFERWAAERADAKLAAKQLALWQEDFRARFLGITRQTPFARLPDADKAALLGEQRAILAALAWLRFPPSQDVASARTTALGCLERAVEAAGDGKAADLLMKAAADALTRLADRTPANGKRLQNSRGELEKIRQDQESITVAIERELLRGADPSAARALAGRLEGVQKRQAALMPRLSGLDLPGFEPRQARAGLALAAAAADLKDGLAYDIVASQGWVRRELERLKAAVDGHVPPDDKAEELARNQAGVAEGVAALGDTPTAKQLEPFAATQGDVFRQLEPFAAPEAPALLHLAREAARLAEAGFRDKVKLDELRTRVKAAADALRALADRMAGVEPDADRLRRLAGYRKAGVEEAKKLAGKGRNPEVSKDAARFIGWELDEFTHTRVGAVAQPLKKRAAELYTRLKNHQEPDRQAGDLKSLADLLEEIAGKAADIAELVVGVPRPAAPEPDPADGYLPSRSFADALRELARLQRAVRDRVGGSGAEVAKLLHPADADPLAELERRQRELAAAITALTRSVPGEGDVTAEWAKAAESARLAADRLAIGQPSAAKVAGEAAAGHLRRLVALAGNRPWGKPVADLAARQDVILKALGPFVGNPGVAAARHQGRARELVGKASDLDAALELAAAKPPPDDPAAKALLGAAGLARKATALLTEAAEKAGEGNPEEPARLRAEAESLLRKAVALAATAGPDAPANPAPEVDPAGLAAGAAVRDAEAAMKRAADALAANNRVAAAGAMQQAADALTRAARAVGVPTLPGK